MSQYWCCLDGSGKPRQDRFVALCGYLGEVNQQEAFSRDWNAQLTMLQLSSIHMVEAMNWRGDWWEQKREEWGDTRDAKRTELLLAFAAIIRKYPLVAVGVCADSRHVSPKAAEALRPDLVLIEHTLELVTKWLRPDDYLCLLFDWEDGYDVLACKLLAKLRLQRPDLMRRVTIVSFGDDKRYGELQAADMFAYVACKELERKTDAPDAPLDPVYVALHEAGKTVAVPVPLGEWFTADQFKRAVEAHQR